MGIDAIVDISSSGLELNRLKLQSIANNIANANTVIKSGVEAYKPLEVIGYSYDVDTLSVDDALSGVDTIEMLSKDVENRKVFDPNHPEANANGYVEYPNINPVEEMANLTTVVRSYEANIKAITAAKAMAMKAMEIGK